MVGMLCWALRKSAALQRKHFLRRVRRGSCNTRADAVHMRTPAGSGIAVIPESYMQPREVRVLIVQISRTGLHLDNIYTTPKHIGLAYEQNQEAIPRSRSV